MFDPVGVLQLSAPVFCPPDVVDIAFPTASELIGSDVVSCLAVLFLAAVDISVWLVRKHNGSDRHLFFVIQEKYSTKGCLTARNVGF